MPRRTDRHHYVFVLPCGCPVGLVERDRRCRDEDKAWKDMYETRARERAAAARGIQAVLVDHATYERDFGAKMLQPCPHT